MPSLFYLAIFERPFALPFLFFEDIGIAAEPLGDTPPPELLEALIRNSLQRCLPELKIDDKALQYVSQRLEKLAKEEESRKTPEKKGKKMDFATSFSTWVGELQPHEVCLVAADYDYFMARRLYAEVDREDVVELSTQWMRKEWEKIKVGYESVVYGFGGGYKDSTPAEEIDAAVDDHRQGKAIDPAALASVGF